MLYRRKILLSILHTFGGRLTRTQVQKLAFIFTRWQESPAFDFVPYRFGCFSFQANQDLVVMTISTTPFTPSIVPLQLNYSIPGNWSRSMRNGFPSRKNACLPSAMKEKAWSNTSTNCCARM